MKNESCACPTTSCVRHGNCMECVAWHREGGKNMPVCLRPLVEKIIAAHTQCAEGGKK